MHLRNPSQLSVALHKETSHFICIANYMMHFYMECNTGLKWASNPGYLPTKIIGLSPNLNE